MLLQQWKTNFVFWHTFAFFFVKTGLCSNVLGKLEGRLCSICVCFCLNPNRGQQQHGGLSLLLQDKCYTFVTVDRVLQEGSTIVTHLLHPGDMTVGIQTLWSSVACGTHREMLSMLLSLSLSKMGDVEVSPLSNFINMVIWMSSQNKRQFWNSFYVYTQSVFNECGSWLIADRFACSRWFGGL